MSRLVRDPYEVLEVPREATPDEIKSAFRKLAARHHPDRNPDDPGAQERFKEINAAYQLLSDPQKKAMFDRFGAAGVGGAGAGTGPFGGMPFDFSNIADMGFDGVFGDLLGAFGFGGKGDKGDLRRDVTLTFQEAVFGCEKEIEYERVESCSDCQGTGASPGSNRPVCGACNGRGKVRFHQAMLPIAVERTCSRCHGTGRLVSVPCGTCHGEGLSRRKKTVVVHIPPGVEDGATHLVDRAGNVPRPGRAAGDLELVIKVASHPFFKRSGDDVICSVPVTFPQATLGSEVEVPTLEGKGKLRIPQGTQPGAMLRIRGKGIPRRVLGGRGDQIVEVVVEVPTHLSERARQLVEELSKEMGADAQPQRRTFLDKLRDLFG